MEPDIDRLVEELAKTKWHRHKKLVEVVETENYLVGIFVPKYSPSPIYFASIIVGKNIAPRTKSKGITRTIYIVYAVPKPGVPGAGYGQVTMFAPNGTTYLVWYGDPEPAIELSRRKGWIIRIDAPYVQLYTSRGCGCKPYYRYANNVNPRKDDIVYDCSCAPGH